MSNTRLILTALLALSIGACADRPGHPPDVAADEPKPASTVALSGPFVIDGRLAADDGTEVLLQRTGRYVGFTFEEIDRAELADGMFRFEGELEAPELVYLSVEGRRGKTPIFLEPATVTVALASDESASSTVTGSALHDEMTRFREHLATMERPIETAEEELSAARKRGDTEAEEELQAELATLRSARDAELGELVSEHGDTTLGAYIALRHLATEMDVDELEPLRARLDPALDGTRYVKALDHRLERLRRVTVGQTTPDFAGPTPDGETVAVADLRGQVVLVDFWASWCTPCRAQNPELKRLYDVHRDRGLEIVGVGLEFDRDAWLGAIEADDLPWINVCDVTGFDTEAAQLFAVRALPYNVVLDRDGTILAKNVHGDELRALLDRTL